MHAAFSPREGGGCTSPLGALMPASCSMQVVQVRWLVICSLFHQPRKRCAHVCVCACMLHLGPRTKKEDACPLILSMLRSRPLQVACDL
eukprot:1161622-Pelagomonas_calceolata.AAC.11